MLPFVHLGRRPTPPALDDIMDANHDRFVAVGWSSVHGHGVFVRRRFLPGETVCYISGDWRDLTPAQVRGLRRRFVWCRDPEFGVFVPSHPRGAPWSSLFDWINFPPEGVVPNARFVAMVSAVSGRPLGYVAVEATRVIEIYTEVFVDYDLA